MRLVLLVHTFTLILSCSIDYGFDELEVIAYRWGSPSIESTEIISKCRLYVTIDEHGRCQLMNYYSFNNYRVPSYGQFTIKKEKLGEILDRFKTIKKDSNLLREMIISGPEPNLNYIIHNKNQTKTIFIRTDNYNSLDSCFIDFYNYIFSFCKFGKYQPLADTVEIYMKCHKIISVLNNRTISSFPPPVRQIEKDTLNND
jgi:hypothetical protein